MYTSTAGTLENSFVTPNTHKPIVGTFARNYVADGLRQAKVTTNDLIGGMLISLTTPNDTPDNACHHLMPNVLEIKEQAQAIDKANGVLLISPTDVAGLNDVAGQPKAGQIARVSLFGSGLNVWLKIDPASTLTAKLDITQKFTYTTSGGLKVDSAGSDKLKLVTGIITDGVELYIDNGAIKQRECKVALFKI